MLNKLQFRKMQATGNDYICIKNPQISQKNLAKMAKTLCKRKFGIGADGLLVAYESKVADVGMQIFNADGSKPEMCGNGLRCFARFVYEKKLVKSKQITIQTELSIKKAQILTDQKTGEVKNVKTSLGKPSFGLKNIAPSLDSKSWIDAPLKFGKFKFNVSLLSLDNPHAVIFVDDLASVDIQKIGPLIEQDARFPKRINIEFIKVSSPRQIQQRTWERGVGETLSCGTGAAAAGVVAVMNKKCQSKLEIKLLGGNLEFNWPNKTGDIFILGEAINVFEGSFELKDLD